MSSGTTFDIVIHYGGDPAYQAAFDAAAARWEQIITADIPDVNSPIYGFIDDLLIDASVDAIDGSGHVLAQAGADDWNWSSSSAIRLSPSRIRACGFPAPGSSRG